MRTAATVPTTSPIAPPASAAPHAAAAGSAVDVHGAAEFGGPGDLWSPETMLAGAVAGCFILTFRAAARASSASIPWRKLNS